MKLDRKDILKALETITIAGEGKNMVESGAVTNVITFGDEVVVDLVLHTPAMHIKKRAEDDIKKTIHDLVSAEAKIKVNIKVEAAENPNQIKGKAIPGIKNIIWDIVDTYNSKLYMQFDSIISYGSWTGGISRKSKMAARHHVEMKRTLTKKVGIEVGQPVMLFHNELHVNYMWITCELQSSMNLI